MRQTFILTALYFLCSLAPSQACTITASGSVTIAQWDTVQLQGDAILPGRIRQWFYGSIPISGATNKNYTICGGQGLAMSGIYHYSDQDSVMPVTYCVSGNITVTVSPMVVPPIFGPTSLCTGATITLSDTLNGGHWYSSDPGVAMVNALTGIVTGVSAGSATITYAMPQPCLPDASMPLSYTSVLITVDSVDVSVTQSGDTLTATATGASYKWLYCDSGFAEISGANMQSYAPAIPGNYAVAVSLGTCTDTSICYAIGSLSVGNLVLIKEGFTLFPNPATEGFAVELATLPAKGAVISILDMTGRCLAAYPATQKKSLLHPALSSGVYFIRLENAGQTAIQKLIVR